MRRILLLLSFVLALAQTASAETTWVSGQHYFPIRPAQPTSTPGKVEVVEVFSYGCPACFQFYPLADELKASLPSNAQMVYVPASWLAAEDWPVFQRAFFAAQALGLVDRTHDAMFDAIWKTRELAISDPKTNRMKNPLPSIADVAKFYAKIAQIKPEAFVDAANSFGVESSMKRADNQIKAYQAEETPTLIVNGKYRLTPRSAGGADQTIELVKWLVAKESK